MSVVCDHNAGFFSCCSVKLDRIIKFVNSNNKLPRFVDSSKQFNFYKGENKNIDVTYDYFEDYNNLEDEIFKPNIKFSISDQYKNFSCIDYNKISPILRKYFTPSKKIIDNMNRIKNLYNIDYDNSIAVYYRGTDKKEETKMVCFKDYLKMIKNIKDIDPNKKIIIQTDTAQFLDYIENNNLKDIIVIKENKISYSKGGIHKEKNNNKNDNDMFDLFSTFLILSKCKYIVCGPSNCSLWMMLYRGHNKDVYQRNNKDWRTNFTHLMKFHTFGDRHSREPWDKISPKYNIKIHHLGALLCSSFGTGKLETINILNRKFKVNDGDYVCFCMGEVDCRTKINELTKKKNYKKIIEEIVNNYIDAIQVNQKLFNNLKICILGLPPIVTNINNNDYPFIGSDKERKVYNCYFNELLKKKCNESNYIYLNVYKHYIDENKYLNKKYNNNSNSVYIKDPEFILKEMNKYNILKKIKIII